MSRKNNFSILVLILGFFLSATLGYSWPWDKKEVKSASSPSKTAPAAVSANALNSQGIEEEAAEEEEEAPLIPELPRIPKVPKVIAAPNIPSAATGLPSIPSAGVSLRGQDSEIERIKKQIQDIIKINDSLKSNYAGQAAEIQKISEQARIHQRLLKDLEAAKAQQQSARPGSEKYLNEEKIRLIRKETEKNQMFLDTLQTQNVSKGISAPSRDQEARKS